jgi:hypothetical protein
MNIKTLLLFAMSITIILVANTGDIFAQCDAGLINALRTQYGEISSSTIDEALYDTSCSKTGSEKRFGLNLSRPEYGELGVKNNSSSTSEACAKRNYEYFSDNKTEIATSFLSPGALKIISECIGGGRHTLSASKKSNIVTIKAASFANNSTDGELAKVKEDGFNVKGDKSGKLVCDGTFAPHEKLSPGGKEITCESNQNENIYVSLTTDRGVVSVYIPRTPNINWEPYVWELNFLGSLVGRNRNIPRDYQCISKGKTFGGVLPVPVPWSAARNDVMRGVCLVTHGAGVLTVDGTPEVLQDKWGFITEQDQHPEKDDRYIVCTLNGKPIGERRINTTLKQVRRSDEAKIGYCANRYGIN